MGGSYPSRFQTDVGEGVDAALGSVPPPVFPANATAKPDDFTAEFHQIPKVDTQGIDSVHYNVYVTCRNPSSPTWGRAGQNQAKGAPARTLPWDVVPHITTAAFWLCLMGHNSQVALVALGPLAPLRIQRPDLCRRQGVPRGALRGVTTRDMSSWRSRKVGPA